MTKNTYRVAAALLIAAALITGFMVGTMTTDSGQTRILRCVRDGAVVFHEPVSSMPSIMEWGARTHGFEWERVSIPGRCVTTLCGPDDTRNICAVAR